MATYISSNNNRFYVGIESTYGQTPVITAGNRIPAVKLTLQQKTEAAQRKDKTGSRTFAGDPSALRKETNFALTTYMTGWTAVPQAPPYGPLFQACLGNPAAIWAGGTVVSMPTASRIVFTAPHNLSPGIAVSCNAEIRFVATVIDNQTVQLNAPLSATLSPGSMVGATANYQPASDLPSATILDYWDPADAVQRLISGAAINQMKLSVNGDFHEFNFSGSAADVVDSASFQSGQAGLPAFPAEPPVGPLNYTIIPGHLGEAWFGSQPAQFMTVTKAEVTLNNNLQLRDNEFGAPVAQGITPGTRDVSIEFSLYAQDDAKTPALYQAARQQSPISVMLQLGQQSGQLFGLYMSNVVPSVPEFDDSETRLQWHFVSCRAQGIQNNEIFVAFG